MPRNETNLTTACLWSIPSRLKYIAQYEVGVRLVQSIREEKLVHFFWWYVNY